MASAQVYVKTELGRAEIDTRAMKLSPALRSILLVVDGQRDAIQLRGLAERLHAPADALDQLARIGLIDRAGATAVPAAPAADAHPDTDGTAPASRYRVLHGLMSEGVRAHLGLRGYFMQLRIERCADAEALRALLPELTAAIAKAKDASLATQWQQGVLEVAG